MRKRFWMLVVAAAGWIYAPAVGYAAEEKAPVRIQVPDLAGQLTDPFEKKDQTTRAVVFFFISNDCPIANKYAPELARIEKAYRPRGVRFWLVHANVDETSESIRQHGKDYSLVAFSVLRDPERALTRAAKATTTPQAAIFSAEGRLLYQGRIDDRFPALGKQRPQPTRQDVRVVLEALLAGKAAPYDHAPPVGCSIPSVP